jgi:hypothetical protein
MTRYRWIDGEVMEIEVEIPQAKRLHIIPDIQPYKSMIDGHMVTSRSEHRNHLRDHNCIEVGNEKMESKPVQSVNDQRRNVLRQQFADGTDRQADKMLNQLRRQYQR